MITTLTIYSILLLVVYNFNATRKLGNIDIESMFMYLLVGGWLIILGYNIYKLKISKQPALTMLDILPLLYQLSGFIIVIGVLIFVADNLLGGKITR